MWFVPDNTLKQIEHKLKYDLLEHVEGLVIISNAGTLASKLDFYAPITILNYYMYYSWFPSSILRHMMRWHEYLIKVEKARRFLSIKLKI